MDATLSVIHGLQKIIKEPIPAAPVWKFNAADIGADIVFKYPSFKGSIHPQILFKVHTVDDNQLIRKLSSTTKGFCPPYQFTLIKADEAYRDKSHAEDSHAWSKGSWVWSSKFSCQQWDAKSKAFKPVSLKTESLITKKGKKKTKLLVDTVAEIFEAQEGLSELKNTLWIEFSKMLADKTDMRSYSYQRFLYYCGHAQIHHLEKQKKKVEAQMADTYESWIRAFPNTGPLDQRS